MNSTSHPPRAPGRGSRVFRWLLIGSAVCVAITAVAALRIASVTRDAAHLRNELFSSLETRATSQIQITAGPVLLGLLRSGLSVLPDLPPEARLAFAAVRSASVGVYGLSPEVDDPDVTAMFDAADTMMRKRDWQRIIAVSDRDAKVMVFAPNDGSARGPQRVCIAVCEGDRLIVVAGTINLGPLVKLVELHGGRPRF